MCSFIRAPSGAADIKRKILQQRTLCRASRPLKGPEEEKRRIRRIPFPRRETPGLRKRGPATAIDTLPPCRVSAYVRKVQLAPDERVCEGPCFLGCRTLRTTPPHSSRPFGWDVWCVRTWPRSQGIGNHQAPLGRPATIRRLRIFPQTRVLIVWICVDLRESA